MLSLAYVCTYSCVDVLCGTLKFAKEKLVSKRIYVWKNETWLEIVSKFISWIDMIECW